MRSRREGQAAWSSGLYVLWLEMIRASGEKAAGAADRASHQSVSPGVGREGFPPSTCPSPGHCIVPSMLSLDEPAQEARGWGLSQSTMDEQQVLPCTLRFDNLILQLNVVSLVLSPHLAPPFSFTSADVLLAYGPARISSASCHRSFPSKARLPMTVQQGCNCCAEDKQELCSP